MKREFQRCNKQCVTAVRIYVRSLLKRAGPLSLGVLTDFVTPVSRGSCGSHHLLDLTAGARGACGAWRDQHVKDAEHVECGVKLQCFRLIMLSLGFRSGLWQPLVLSN